MKKKIIKKKEIKLKKKEKSQILKRKEKML